MRKSRVLQIVFAIFFLIAFIIYSYLRIQSSPRSSEVGTDEEYPSVESAQPVVAETAAVSTPEPTAEPTPEPTPSIPQIDLTSWEYVLVNTESTLDAGYAPPEVVKVANDCPVDSRIAEALTAFADGVTAQGLPVYLSSGYRAYSEQQYLFNNKLNQGYSAEDAAKIVAVPGTSEHQTGLCCDITDIYRNPKSIDDNENTETFKWLNAHCAEYGFILRYPEDKQDITGIMYEPWHFRYVGVEAATYIKEHNLCLEEFIALYE